MPARIPLPIFLDAWEWRINGPDNEKQAIVALILSCARSGEYCICLWTSVKTQMPPCACFALDAMKDALVGCPSLLRKLGAILMEDDSAITHAVAQIFDHLSMKFKRIWDTGIWALASNGAIEPLLRFAERSCPGDALVYTFRNSILNPEYERILLPELDRLDAFRRIVTVMVSTKSANKQYACAWGMRGWPLRAADVAVQTRAIGPLVDFLVSADVNEHTEAAISALEHFAHSAFGKYNSHKKISPALPLSL